MPCPPQLFIYTVRPRLPGHRPTLTRSWLEVVEQGRYANHRCAYVPLRCGIQLNVPPGMANPTPQ